MAVLVCVLLLLLSVIAGTVHMVTDGRKHPVVSAVSLYSLGPILVSVIFCMFYLATTT